MTAVKSMLMYRDILAVLPTGYGKNLIFQSKQRQPTSRRYIIKPVFSRERFTTVTAYRGFVTKSQLLETLFTRNLLIKVGRIQRAI